MDNELKRTLDSIITQLRNLQDRLQAIEDIVSRNKRMLQYLEQQKKLGN